MNTREDCESWAAWDSSECLVFRASGFGRSVMILGSCFRVEALGFAGSC